MRKLLITLVLLTIVVLPLHAQDGCTRVRTTYQEGDCFIEQWTTCCPDGQGGHHCTVTRQPFLCWG